MMMELEPMEEVRPAVASSSTSQSTALIPAAASFSAAKPSGPQRYTIRGVTVDFPYPAYECQQVYMEKVIQAVQLSQHALLESPTGTGKTLCLLCASLAWRQSFVAATDLSYCPPSALQASLSAQLNAAAYGHESLTSPPPALRATSNSMAIPFGDGAASVDGLRGLYGLDRDVTIGGDVSMTKSSGLLANKGGGPNANLATASAFANIGASRPQRPKVIYASRTHSQLAKVASELKQSIYRPKMTILGSRQQLCVHPVVSKLEGAGQTHACRALTSEKACNFYEHLSTFTAENTHLSNAVLDIEDLVVMGREQHMCPYFYSRERMSDAELVLLPYNYLIDPTIRNRLGLKYDNSLLIFDEAHNLEGVCGDSASFDLSAADLAAAIQEVQKCIDTIRDPTMSAMIMDGSSIAGNDIPDLESLAILKAVLLEFESLLDRQPLPDSGDGLTQPGEFIFKLLEQCQIRQENKDMLLDLLEKSVSLLFADRTAAGGGQDVQRKSCALDKFSSAIKIIFKGGAHKCVESASYYRVHIHTKEPPRTSAPAASRSKALFSADPGAKKHQDVGRILSYWCFNPGIAMQDLTHADLGVRCMLLTSGTLSPMESFAHELKLPFPIRLENPHVIQPEQIWVGILERGPASQVLNSGFKQRENMEYINDLGNAIVNFSRVVPDGLLVFFPSYSVLASCHQAWKLAPAPGKPSIAERIGKHKALIVEPRTSAEFPQAIAEFESKLDDPAYTGAIFFAVCRGKVSEGLDFADRAGRAVIVTGLPYPAFKDPKVRLKRTFLDEAARVPGIKQLSGTEWYGQQAARAVNQAIGRVIRHRGDYGAIILADARFGQANVRSQLSRWIRPYVQTYSSFGAFAGGIQKFFKHAAVAYPDSEKREKKDGAEDARKRAELGSDLVSKVAELQRANKAWTVSDITSPPALNMPILKTSKQNDMDWNESYAALTDGLAPMDVTPAPTPSPMVHSNPTLVKKHPTSLLMSLLKPASMTTQTHSSTVAKASPAPSAASSSSTNRLLKLSSISSTPAPAPVKIDVEYDTRGPEHQGNFAEYLLAGPAGVKSEQGLARGGSNARSSSPGPTAAAAASSAKPAASVIKDMIARVKTNLSQTNFLKFKSTLQKLSELKSVTPTAETYFQHVAAINATVQTMASLLFGFDADMVAAAAPSANAMSPLDSSIAIAFEPHIPVPFRPQYTKAVQTLMTRYAIAAPPRPPPVSQPAPSSQPEHKVKSESSLPLKREFSSITSSQESQAQLPPPSSQQEFVGRVKAKLDQRSYAVFKSLILSLESVPTPIQITPIPPPLMLLFQRLQKVLDSLPLLRAYATLIPQRLRPVFNNFIASCNAAAQLKWTGAVDIEAMNDDDEEKTSTPAAKRPRLSNNIPMFPRKTIVLPQ